MGRNYKITKKYLLIGNFILLLILFLWELLIRVGVLSNLILPLPSAIIAEFFNTLLSMQFYYNIFNTLSVWFTSLLLGLVIGICLGIISGYSEKIRDGLLPVISYFRSIPPIAMFPVFLIMLGPGPFSIGIVATIGAILYVYPTTTEAARLSTERYKELSYILKLSDIMVIKKIIIPSVLIQAVASIRVSSTYAFAVVVAGEMLIGGRKGIGAAILDYSERYFLEKAYTYIIITGLVGYFIDGILRKISLKLDEKIPQF